MEKTKHTGVYSLGDGRYLIRVYARCPKTGRMKDNERTIAARSAGEAAVQREELRRELQRGDIARLVRQTLRQYATSWLAAKMPRLKPSTRKTYGEAVQAILISLGDYYVDAITLEDLVKWRDGLEGAPATINGRIRVLKTIMRDAVYDLRLLMNPTMRLESLQETRAIEDDEAMSLTADELRRVLDWIRAHQEQWYPLVVTLALTGMRFGEATALRWEDLDLAQGVARIRRSQWRGRVGDPKTRGSRRLVVLAPEVVEALTIHRQKLLRSQHVGLKQGLVFPTNKGTYASNSVLTKPVRAALTAIGVTRPFHAAHGFRHTFNDLVRKVAQEQVRQALVGHETQQMGDRYSHVRLDERRAAVARVVALLRPSSAPE